MKEYKRKESHYRKDETRRSGIRRFVSILHIQARGKGKNEDFGAKLRKIARRAGGLEEKKIVEQFVKGLRPETRKMLACSHPQSLDECIGLAGKLERIDEEACIQTTINSVRFTTAEKKEAEDPQPGNKCFYCVEIGHWKRECPKQREQDEWHGKVDLSGGWPKSSQRFPSRFIRCYECGESGHGYRECRKLANRLERYQCKKCGKTGHVETVCAAQLN